MRCVCCLRCGHFVVTVVLARYVVGTYTRHLGAFGGYLGGRGMKRLLALQWMHSRGGVLC